MSDKPDYVMPSENEPRGNIFVMITEVRRLLPSRLADEMTKRVMGSHSYEEAKLVIGDYVNVI